MEPKEKCIYLFFALLSASLYTDVAGRLVKGSSLMPDSVIEYSEGNEVDANGQITDYNNMTPFLSAMEKFAENVDKKLDLVLSYENDLKQFMKESIEHSHLEETTNIALITDQIATLVKDKNTETMNIINLELNEMKNDMRYILEILVQAEMRMREDIKELANKIALLTALLQHPIEKTNVNNIETDNVFAESIEMTTEEQTMIKDIASEQSNKQTPSSTTNYIDESEYITSEEWNSNEYSRMDDVSKESEETTTEDQNVIKDIITKWERDQQAESITASFAEGSDYNPNKTSLCDLVVPSSIITEQDVWIVERKPIFDDLDTFAIVHTGCTYTSLHNRESFYTPPLEYDGSLFEWRGALRAPENGDIVVQWGSHSGYAFYIGVNGNADTLFIQRNPWTDLVVLPTPRILSIDRYVPFYIRIREGVLTFGQECESEPMFTYNVTIQAGEPVYVSFYPFSQFGGKHLFHCPSTGSGAVTV